MVLLPDRHVGADRPLPRAEDAVGALRRDRPDHTRALQPRPALRGAEGRAPPGGHGHRRHLLHGPRSGVLRVRARGLRPDGEPLVLRGRLRGGLLEPRTRLRRGAQRHAQPRLQDPLTAGLLPHLAGRHPRRPARPHGRGARVDGAALRVPAPRGRLRRAGGDQRPLQHAAQDGGPDPAAEVRDQERGAPGRQVRHVHAEAAVRGERLGYARAHVAGARRREPDVRLRRLRAALARGAQLHRRDPRPRAGADGVLRADHELVPPAGAGLRGAGEPRVLAAQPLRGLPHPGVLGLAEGQARRVPARRTRPPTPTWRSRRC